MPEIPAASRSSHILAAAVFILTCGVGAWFWIGVNRATADPSLVVLPFTGDAGEFTDALTTNFTRNRAMRVIAKDTAAEAKDYDLHKISRMLYADSVLRGDIVRHGDKVRISARLQRTTDGSIQWTGSWEGSAEQVQIAESEIVTGVTRAMHVPSREPN